jgi:hypothetical protein
VTIDLEMVAPGDAERSAYVLDIIRQRTAVEGLTVLDLACRTGAFTSVLADAGALAYGIEGNAANLDNMYPSKGSPRYLHADVRGLGREMTVGGVTLDLQFEVTLCLGILYHLEAADAVQLLRAMREVTTGFAIVDTHVGMHHTVVDVNGHGYRGQVYHESPSLWSSIGNRESFWFTDESLDDACIAAGWSTVEHLAGVRWNGEPQGRRWLVLK